MRRLDVHLRKKLRNPARRLRSLARWPDWIVGHLLDQGWGAGGRFRSCKSPVFAKLSDPPHATAEMQRACIAATFPAAAAVETSQKRPRDCRVACLVTTPVLAQSEVTLFFDEDYFPSLPPAAERKRTVFDGGWIEAEPADVADISRLAPPPPVGLSVGGGALLREFDES